MNPALILRLFAVLVLSSTLNGVAATVQWVNPEGGDWSVATNWQPRQVPTATDTVLIQLGGAYVVRVDVDVRVASLDMGTDKATPVLAIGTRQLGVTGTASIRSGAVIAMTGGGLRGTFQVEPGARLELAGTATKDLYATTLNNRGTVVWSGGSINCGSTPTTLVNNEGVWEMSGDDTMRYAIGGPTPTFVNLGVVRKTGGTGSSVWASVFFDNRGTVEVEKGTVQLNGGGVLGGSWTVGTGALVSLTGGEFEESGGTFGGAGESRMSGGTLRLTKEEPKGLQLLDGTVVVNGKSYQGGAGIVSLTLRGSTLSGSNVVASGGVLRIESGGLRGQLTVEAGGRLELTGTATKDLYATTLNNRGTVVWSGGSINCGSTPTTLVNNEGVWEMSGDDTMRYAIGGPVPTFVNLGVVRKTGGTGASVWASVFFDNRGKVEVEKGTVQLNGGGVLGGSWTVGTGALVSLTGGEFEESGGTFGGAGESRMSGGTLRLTKEEPKGLQLLDGTVVVNGKSYQGGGGIVSLTLRGSTLSGSNVVASGGVLRIESGGLRGQLTVEAGGRLELAGTATKEMYATTLNNRGTVVWSGGSINCGSTPTTLVNNEGVWEMSGDDTMRYAIGGPVPTFVNLGVVRKTGGIGASVWASVFFDNRGTVEVEKGTMQLNGGGVLGGSWTVGTGALVSLTGGEFEESGGTFGGAGESRMSGGTLRLTKEEPKGLRLLDGTVVVNGKSYQGGAGIVSLTLRGSTLSGSNVVASGGVLRIESGGLRGQLTVEAGGRLELAGTATKDLYATTLNNRGTVVWSGGSINCGSTPTTLVNNEGVWEMTGDDTMRYAIGGPTPTFVNLGVVRKTGGAGATVLSTVKLINRAKVELLKGTLRVPAGFENSGVVSLDAAGFDGGGSVLSGGEIVGIGSVSGVVVADGSGLNPGLVRAGRMLFPSGLNMRAGARLELGVQVGSAGVEADALQVTGPVSISNAVLVVAVGASVAPGTEFTLIENDGSDAVLGLFEGLPEGGQVLSGGQAFRIRYRGGSGNDVTLVREAAEGCLPLVSGLVAWWRGDGNTLDTVGGNTGRLEGGTRFGAGKLGQGFVLDGVDDHVTIPDSASLSLRGAITVTAWIQPTVVTGARVVASKYATDAGQASWALMVLDGGALRFSVLEGGGAGTGFRAFDTAPGVVKPGAFQHVAGSFNAANQQLLLFVNGVVQSATLVPGSGTVAAIFDSTTPIRIGSIVGVNGVMTDFFSGIIDEVELYARALSAAEIRSLAEVQPLGRCLDQPYLVGPPDGVVLGLGVRYSVPIRAVLGSAPYGFSLVSGALPPGISIAPEGAVVGTPSAAGVFDAVVGVKDGQGAQTSRALRMTVTARAPKITTQPQSETVVQGGAVVFGVVAQGSPAPVYQWQLEGVNLPGATQSRLELVGVQPNQAGRYRVIASNAGGSVTSLVAKLTVVVPPSITLQPQSQAVPIGGAVTLSVAVAGTGPFSYQWRRNGERIPGATLPTLTLNNFQPRDAGVFNVVVSTASGAAKSGEARLTVGLPAVAFADRFAERGSIQGVSGVGRGSTAGATREVGEPVHAGKRGGRSVWVSWVAPADGLATIGTRGSSIDTLLAVYTGTAVDALVEVGNDEDSGGFFSSLLRFNTARGQVYQIAVDALGGGEGEFVLDWDLDLGGDRAPEILTAPLSQTVTAGSDVAFSVVAVNPPPVLVALEYQWFFKGLPIPGATSPTLRLPAVGLGALGRYEVEVRRGLAAVRPRPAILQVNANEAGLVVPTVASEDKFLDVVGQPGAGAGPVGLVAPAGPGRWRGAGRPTGGLASGYTGTQLFSTVGSTTEAGEPDHCGVIGGASQWFVYEAAAAGDLVVTTDGSDFDTVLAVYTGDVVEGFSNLVLLGCDNDGGADGVDSQVRVPVVQGGIYYIAVDGVNGVSGTVQLAYSLVVPLRLTSAAPQAGGMRVGAAGTPGLVHVFERSVDLVTWVPFLTTNAPSTRFDVVDPSAPTGPAVRYYYRVFVDP